MRADEFGKQLPWERVLEEVGEGGLEEIGGGGAGISLEMPFIR